MSAATSGSVVGPVGPVERGQFRRAQHVLDPAEPVRGPHAHRVQQPVGGHVAAGQHDRVHRLAAGPPRRRPAPGRAWPRGPATRPAPARPRLPASRRWHRPGTWGGRRRRAACPWPCPPEPHDGSGSRSTIGYSRICGAPAIRPGTSSQPNFQSANHGSTSSHPPAPGSSRRLVAGLPSRAASTSATQFTSARPRASAWRRDRVGDELQRRVGTGDGHRTPGQERLALGDPAPHHDAAPARRRLAGVQLCPDPRVQPVRADEHVGRQL